MVQNPSTMTSTCAGWRCLPQRLRRTPRHVGASGTRAPRLTTRAGWRSSWCRPPELWACETGGRSSSRLGRGWGRVGRSIRGFVAFGHRRMRASNAAPCREPSIAAEVSHFARNTAFEPTPGPPSRFALRGPRSAPEGCRQCFTFYGRSDRIQTRSDPEVACRRFGTCQRI